MLSNFLTTLSPICCHYIEIGSLIYEANQWNGFYIMATLFHTLFFPFMKKPPFYKFQPNQTYFPQKHKTQNAN